MLYQQGNRLVYAYDAEQLWIEPWGPNALRVRATRMRSMPDEDWALEESPLIEPEISTQESSGTIINGKIMAVVTASGKLTIWDSKGKLLLEEYTRTFDDMKDPKSSCLNIYGREFKPLLGGDYHLTARFESLDPKEKVYGMGQYQHPYLDIKGTQLELAQRNSQASVPFAVSSRGYGFLWNNPSIGNAIFAKNIISFEALSTKALDYWVVAGDSPAEIVRAYAGVTGKVPMMPEYGLGFWQCKLRYQTQEELLNVAREFGHIGPFVQLSNKLSSHGIKISFVSAPGTISRILNSLVLRSHVQIVPINIPHVDGLPPGLDSTADMPPLMAELLKTAADKMAPQVKTLLAQLKPQFIFFDFAHQWLPSIASELGIKSLYFRVFSAVFTAYMVVPNRVTPAGESPTADDLKRPPHGFPPSSSVTSVQTHEARGLTYVFKSFHGNPHVYDRVKSSVDGCDAIVIKTCAQMEGIYVDYIKTQFRKPIFLIGPLVPEPPSDVLEPRWKTWLGSFPARSVIFCSFGSETFLDVRQIKELALGLELTSLPFFLVLNFSDGNGDERLKDALPEGFDERVKGRGLVQTGWVQQQLILANSSVGCFLCHAGFSSVTEALVNDCQLVLLPLKGDQYLNSKLFSGDMKTAVEVNRRDEDGYFCSDDVCEAIKTVMVNVEDEPGITVRANQRKWRDFLLDEDTRNGFVVDLVDQMKDMAKA